MSAIVAARAYANNQVAFIAWKIDAPIPGCLGFELTRIYPDGEVRIIAAWVPFKGQSNPDWKPQDTSVWPVQKFTWRDLTLRQRRDVAELRDGEVMLKYRVRPVVKKAAGLEAVPVVLPKSYEGNGLALSYADEGIETNQVRVTTSFDGFRATFTSGILAGQWLTRVLEQEAGTNLKSKQLVDAIKAHIAVKDDRLRKYLAGDVLPLIQGFFKRAADIGGKLRLALYELHDEELLNLIVSQSDTIEVILSTAGQDKATKDWDVTNQHAREKLISAGVKVYHRMFNNSAHIGHNKFAVLLDSNDEPQAVLSGSVNWTETGLCGQSNNSIVIDSPEIAAQFNVQWEKLLEDTNELETQGTNENFSLKNSNVQGAAIRAFNAVALGTVPFGGAKVSVWFSPNTKRKTKGDETPLDLQAVFRLMRQAKKAIFFASFMPSRQGKQSIVAEAIDIGRMDRSLLVYGAVSDPTVLPNYHIPVDSDGDGKAEKVVQPNTFEEENVHVVLASALGPKDLVGAFEKKETATVGRAIIHDKIVIIDPLSDEDCVVVMGSHNNGFKASYANDENLVIIKGNRALAEAYVVHVLDVWEHYRFRAVQIERRENGKEKWEGFLSKNDQWQAFSMNSARSKLAQYFANGAG